MIDVSRFTVGERCPRCVGRRVYAVNVDKDLWLCVPNAMPFAWHRDQTIEHEVEEWAEFPLAQRQRNAEQLAAFLAEEMTHVR
jgi:hypothetical protein